MKKLVVLLISGGLFIFSSCEKENITKIENALDSTYVLTDKSNSDSELESSPEVLTKNKSSSSSSPIIGQWETVDFRVDGSHMMDMGSGYQLLEIHAETVEGSPNTFVTFHDDNSYTAENKDYKMKFTTKINGTLLHTETKEVGSVFQNTGKWSQNGDILNFIVDGHTYKYKIESVSSSQLVLSGDITTIDFGANPVPDNMEMNSKITYRR